LNKGALLLISLTPSGLHVFTDNRPTERSTKLIETFNVAENLLALINEMDSLILKFVGSLTSSESVNNFKWQFTHLPFYTNFVKIPIFRALD